MCLLVLFTARQRCGTCVDVHVIFVSRGIANAVACLITSQYNICLSFETYSHKHVVTLPVVCAGREEGTGESCTAQTAYVGW